MRKTAQHSTASRRVRRPPDKSTLDGDGAVESDSLGSLRARIRAATGGLPVQPLAARLGFSQGSFYNWLSGRSAPTLEKLMEFAQATGVRLAWLVSGDGPMRGDAPEGYVIPRVVEPRSKKASIAFEHDFLESLARAFYGEIYGNADEIRLEPLLVRADDDAMAPTIRRGDLVLVNWVGVVVSFSGTATDGIYYLGNRQMRRLEWTRDAVAISADSRPSAVRRVDWKDAPFIIGPVLWRGDAQFQLPGKIRPRNPMTEGRKRPRPLNNPGLKSEG